MVEELLITVFPSYANVALSNKSCAFKIFFGKLIKIAQLKVKLRMNFCQKTIKIALRLFGTEEYQIIFECLVAFLAF